jgi:hypothetical protein
VGGFGTVALALASTRLFGIAVVARYLPAGGGVRPRPSTRILKRGNPFNGAISHLDTVLTGVVFGPPR